MIFNSSFININFSDGVCYLTYKNLEKIDFIKHAFSTKLGGVSKNQFRSMNLGFNRGDSNENVIENYKLFSNAVGIKYENLVSSVQIHEANVRKVTKADRGIGIYRKQDMQSVDAMITNEKGVALVTHYADCTPIYLVDTKKQAIGLVHSGWRGTVKEIAKNTVIAMKENYRSNPSDIIACIGPVICKDCYEVDLAVAKEFYNLEHLPVERFIEERSNNKFHIDLAECCKQTLIYCGLKEENIIKGDVCTKCNSDLLFSHRVTGNDRGGMVAIMEISE